MNFYFFTYILVHNVCEWCKLSKWYACNHNYIDLHCTMSFATMYCNAIGTVDQSREHKSSNERNSVFNKRVIIGTRLGLPWICVTVFYYETLFTLLTSSFSFFYVLFFWVFLGGEVFFSCFWGCFLCGLFLSFLIFFN